MKLSRTTALGLALALGISGAQAANDSSPAQRAAKLVTEVCSSCHRPAGQSDPALVPTLAGQQKSYLVWQMRAYRFGFRDDPQAHDKMWSQAGKLDDALVEALAAYYAALPPRPGTAGDPALIARGKALYEHGLPASKVTDCASCHGPPAEGHDMFPRLAGQRADYLVRQLSLIQLHLRNVGIMHSTVEGLSDEDIQALAAYLQSL
ncbi:MAG: c-type cytochrome [Burkholderiales bacterium]